MNKEQRKVFETAIERVGDFESWRQEVFDSKAIECADYYDGRQIEDDTADSQFAVMANATLPNIDIKCHALTFTDPECSVEALDDSSGVAEEILEKILNKTWRYTKSNRQIKKALLWMNVFGFAACQCYMRSDGWPGIRAIDPRMISFDPDCSDMNESEWVARKVYLPMYEVEAMFPNAKAMNLQPDVVRINENAINDRRRVNTKTTPRVELYEYWQRENRQHIIYAKQNTETPILIHEISDVDGSGYRYDFPDALAIPIRFLTGVPSVSSILPHSYVELGIDAQKNKNKLLTYMMQLLMRTIPFYISPPNAFDEEEAEKIRTGIIGELVESRIDDPTKALQPVFMSAFPQALVPLMNYADEELYLQHNINEALQGKPAQPRVSATAEAARTQLGSTRTNGERNDFANYVADLFDMMRLRWLYHGGDDTTMSLRMSDGSTYYQNMSIEGLSNPVNLNFPCIIRVREGTLLAYDSVSEQQMKLQLFQMISPFIAQPGILPFTFNMRKLFDDIFSAFGIRDTSEYIQELGPEEVARANAAQALSGGNFSTNTTISTPNRGIM